MGHGYLIIGGGIIMFFLLLRMAQPLSVTLDTSTMNTYDPETYEIKSGVI